MNIITTTSSFSVDDFPDGFNVTRNPYRRKLTEDEAAELLEKYRPAGMIAGVEPLTRKVLEKARFLKVISRCGTGIDSVDLEAAKEFGIRVYITPEAPRISVAELTVGMILCLARRINVLDAGIRKGGWKGQSGNLVHGKTAGIIGCGRIGSYTAELLKAFGCSLLGHDPYIGGHENCRMVSIEELLISSDIVTLHIPYTESNRHIIGRKELSLMKPAAVLINAARGGLVDEDALYEALRDKKIAGAALDCFENEPYSGPLTELDNTVLSPHTGANAIEGRRMMEKEALDNLLTGLREAGCL